MGEYTKIILIVASFLIAGCENGVLVLNDEERQIVKNKEIERGKARKALFVECMELAAKMPRQSDDDVADIVEECQAASYYMTNYLTK